MFLSQSERKWRKEEIERERGITPETSATLTFNAN